MLSTVLDRRTLITAAAVSSISTISQPTSALSASTRPLTLPRIGLGTCCDGYDTSYATALDGIRMGYSLIDTAAHYDSEAAVGAALVEAKKQGLDQPRYVTKLWFDDLGYSNAISAAERSMASLQTECLDILLIHFPGSVDAVQSPSKNRKLREDTWRALETLQADGRCRTIGVSNWTRRHLKETLATCQVKPQILQTELHPRLPQVELIDYAREHGIRDIMAHCPLAHGSPNLLNSPVLKQLADERGNGCSPAQLCLRWSIDHGFIPIPKASSERRLQENLAAAALSPLTPAELRAIDALESFSADARVSFDPALVA